MNIGEVSTELTYSPKDPRFNPGNIQRDQASRKLHEYGLVDDILRGNQDEEDRDQETEGGRKKAKTKSKTKPSNLHVAMGGASFSGNGNDETSPSRSKKESELAKLNQTLTNNRDDRERKHAEKMRLREQELRANEDYTLAMQRFVQGQEEAANRQAPTIVVTDPKMPFNYALLLVKPKQVMADIHNYLGLDGTPVYAGILRRYGPERTLMVSNVIQLYQEGNEELIKVSVTSHGASKYLLFTI